MSEYTKKIKKKIINRYLNGESISSISKSTGIARSTIYEWINNANKCAKITKDLNLRDIHDLKIKCDRQNKIINIIRLSGCTKKSSQMEKYHAIDKLSTKYNVHTICEALEVSKGSYYNYLLRNKKENTVYAKNYELFTNLIEQIYNEIDKMERSKIQVNEFKRLHEEFYPLVKWGLILLILSFILKHTIFKSITD